MIISNEIDSDKILSGPCTILIYFYSIDVIRIRFRMSRLLNTPMMTINRQNIYLYETKSK
ncbi:hypothetical protein DERP_001265 [Dermatophagoides pteronyssinus]|uniref:Uncharacterized protein n=1 Tax=Dermatophagoides pteronyssinus TaxID=6956 RepID=A0ABQ8JDZ2_DERPT|nr:hypothetical protein DERP_001265 [Dermatophagoides pteronyssinus]